MRTVYAQKNKKIILGRQGEDKAVRVVWPGIVSDWSGLYGGGSFQLSVRRFGDENAYPVVVEVNGDDIRFTVTSAETAIAGNGKCELTYIANGTIAKSATWETVVLNSLTGQTPSEPPEEPSKSWFTSIQGQIGNLADLATTSKDNLVSAINEAAQSGGGSGGGGAPIELDTTLTQSGKAADAKAVGDALAGKQPTGTYLTEETDPTVPDWAKEPTKPGYTASEVGADPSGTASSQVSAHNTGADTHSDIRLLIQGLTERLNALADSDDTTLDQLSEVVAYIKSNRSLIEDITTSKVSVADIIDNLTTNAANKPLSAAQGVALKALIDAITIPTALPNPNALTFTGAVTGRYDGSAPLEVEIPSGGGGGNPLYVKGGTTLAEGTIPSGLAQYTFTDTGLKLYEVLQEWKIFFIQVYCAGEVNNINIFTYQNNSQPFYNPGKDCNYALSIFEGVTKDSVKFMFFSAGVGNYWDVYSPTGTISSHHMNPAPTLSIKHIPPDTGLYLRNYGKDTGHDYLWKVTGLVKWG